MRLVGFVRTGRVLPPALATLAALAVLYGGGRSQPAEAYGVSAAVLFPVLAWQAKLVLDTEPDVQRRLAVLALGSVAREQTAGLLAAASASLGTILVAMLLPWAVGGMAGPRTPRDLPVAVGVAWGGWAHLLAVLAAVALGALASRAATGATWYGIAVLVVGSMGSLVLSLRDSVAPWLVPPLMAVARSTAAGAPEPVTVVRLTAHAVGWAALILLGYAWLRRRRC